jgi:DNA ligase 1
MSVDAVLIYAQRGSGRRSGVYSDYTFALWSGPPEDSARTLVPFAIYCLLFGLAMVIYTQT